jgi:hypothetical protein
MSESHHLFEVGLTHLYRYKQAGTERSHRQRVTRFVWTTSITRAVELAQVGLEAPLADSVKLNHAADSLVYDAAAAPPRAKDLKFERGDGDEFVAVTALGKVIVAPEDGVWALYVPNPDGVSGWTRSRSIHPNYDTAISRAQKWLADALAVHF